MLDHRNTQRFQIICVSHPRQHEKLWGVDCPPTQYHLLISKHLEREREKEIKRLAVFNGDMKIVVRGKI